MTAAGAGSAGGRGRAPAASRWDVTLGLRRVRSRVPQMSRDSGSSGGSRAWVAGGRGATAEGREDRLPLWQKLCAGRTLSPAPPASPAVSRCVPCPLALALAEAVP